jgi:hypothetical protein
LNKGIASSTNKLWANVAAQGPHKHVMASLGIVEGNNTDQLYEISNTVYSIWQEDHRDDNETVLEICDRSLWNVTVTVNYKDLAYADVIKHQNRGE